MVGRNPADVFVAGSELLEHGLFLTVVEGYHAWNRSEA